VADLSLSPGSPFEEEEEEEESMATPTARRVIRRVLLAVAAIALGGLLAGTLYRVSVEPGAAIVKAVFESGSEVTPPSDFATIDSQVRESRKVPISTPEAPVGSVNIFRPRHPNSSSLPIILWVHGGGFISSSADTVKDYAVMLAARGYVVASLDYSLAPGSRHPVPVEQANSAIRYLRSHASLYGADATRIFLGGDSAGAQIASEVAAVQTDPVLAASMHIAPSVPMGELRGIVLFCGLYDMTSVGTTGFPGLRTYLWAYTGSREWTTYPQIDELSTTKTASANYPATFVSVGDADPFRTQEAELAHALRAKGVDVTALTWNGTGDHLGHEYQFDFTTPQAKAAFGATLSFLSSRAAGQ
jgi:acetyl esterase/lipase